MTVEVATGTAMVQGRFCENDAALTLSVSAADATYARIDRVVVRLNASPGRTIDILVKKGTPAPSPVPPGLTRTPETWELSLAQIFVAAGRDDGPVREYHRRERQCVALRSSCAGLCAVVAGGR